MSYSSILLYAAVLPIFVLCYFIYKKDVNKEPTRLLAKIFIFGALTIIPILPCELFLEVFFPTEGVNGFMLIFVNVFISVGIVEEGFKWIVTKFFGYNNKEFDEIYDIIVYSVFASLGFACVENIAYVFNYGLINAIVRALLSVPGHTCFAVIMGYFLSQAKVNSINANKSGYIRNILLSIVIPSLVHTMYDALLFAGIPFLIFLSFDIVMVCFCFCLVNKMAKIQVNVNSGVQSGNIVADNNGHVHYNSQNSSTINFCPVCGRPVQGASYCGSCGFKIK